MVTKIYQPLDTSCPSIRYRIENELSEDYLMDGELEETLKLYQEDGLNITLTTYYS